MHTRIAMGVMWPDQLFTHLAFQLRPRALFEMLRKHEVKEHLLKSIFF